jgi:hypothetical protein
MLLKIIALQVLLIVLVVSRFQTIALLSTNDIHGSAFPTTLYRSDTNESYSYGGL